MAGLYGVSNAYPVIAPNREFYAQVDAIESGNINPMTFGKQPLSSDIADLSSQVYNAPPPEKESRGWGILKTAVTLVGGVVLIGAAIKTGKGLNLGNKSIGGIFKTIFSKDTGKSLLSNLKFWNWFKKAPVNAESIIGPGRQLGPVPPKVA
jgi:hypothetical protein